MAFWDPDSLSYVIVWEAWATFAVGILAVAGAFVIGWRQAGISERQTEILVRQVEIEQLKIRTELYDRRVEVFESIRNYLDRCAELNGLPGENYDERLASALGKSRFLFGDAMQDWLDEIASARIELIRANSMADHRRQDTPLSAMWRRSALTKMAALRTKLNDRFRPHLGLTDSVPMPTEAENPPASEPGS